MASKKMIDLDALESGKAVVAEEVPVTTGPGAVAAMPKSKGVEAMFDRYKKMAFLFDISGSMGEGMLPDEIDKLYRWSDEILEKFLAYMRKQVKEQFLHNHSIYDQLTDAEYAAKVEEVIVQTITRELQMAGAEEFVDEEDEDDLTAQGKGHKAQAIEHFKDMTEEEKDDMLFDNVYGFPPVIGQELKYHIIRQQLHRDNRCGVELQKTGIKAVSMAKMDVMKMAASNFISERFTKVPDAQVLAYKFDDNTVLMTSDITKDGLLRSVDMLRPEGGTNIFSALSIAISEFKRAQSAVGSHHIVLVTDAESGDGEAIEKQLLPKMKELNIVLDFIQIKGMGEMGWYYKSTLETLKKVCAATGGEFVEVNTPTDFNQKFLKAANRLCLPLAR